MEGLEALFRRVRLGLENFMMLSNHPNQAHKTADLKFFFFNKKKSV